MNIVLFGGSFNPPHLGHQIVISQAFDLIPDLDQLWLLPDYQHAFPKKTTLAPVNHRLSMTKLLENSKVKTQTCAIDKKMSSGHTIEPISYLLKTYPQHRFSFLLGSDNLPSFHKWGRYQELLKLIPFYIYPRVGFPFKPLRKNMTPLIHPLQIITNISSTMVRKRLKANSTIKHLIPQSVAQYIKTQQLYS